MNENFLLSHGLQTKRENNVDQNVGTSKAEQNARRKSRTGMINVLTFGSGLGASLV
jgi:hydrogenase maturation factor HypE